jgi:predicted dehydrogenase
MRIVAVCDIAPDNLGKGLDVAKKRHDPEAQGYADYREMLERRDIEAVIVATPLWMHERVTVDALNAGKNVFCEKTMAHSEAECRNMAAVARSSGYSLQIGHQRTRNPLYHEAYQLIQDGVIGDVYHFRALWHRNNDWRRSVPEIDLDPTQFGYPTLEHLKNWRLYKKFSQGLMAELGSHQLQIVNWLTGAVPTKVYGTGGIHRFRDGREVSDHVYVMFEYPEDVTFTFSSIQSNKFDHYYEQIMGTEGTILLTGEREALLFSEGKKGSKATQISAAAATAGGAPVMSASESRLRDAAGSAVSGSASGYNPLSAYRDELAAFCNTIRHGAPNLCDAQEGFNACVPIIRANEAIEQKKIIELPPELYKL